jgi:uncharacterized protein (DUF2252 family)
MVTAATDSPAPTSMQERADLGRAERARVPRASQAEPGAGNENRDPVALLEEQAASRVPELVPIRYGRMSASPFAFFRGAAYVMASDLARSPQTGLRVQLCGDAHLSNFGGFGTPERELIFDLNDFDETLPGPFEWDVKRLAASIEVAARARGFAPKVRRAMVRDAAAEYRTAMRRFGDMNTLDVWYSRVDTSAIADQYGEQVKRNQVKRFEKAVAKAKVKDSARAFNKLAHSVNGTASIVADPPLILPIEDLLPDAAAHELEDSIREMIDAYRQTLPRDRRQLVDRYRYAHLARKVVGVGSVGTRAWVLLMLGRDSGDPLFLQAKEAQASVLEPFAGKSEFGNEGQRVVEGQRVMQAASDIFLGWLQAKGLDGEDRDFYIRQLWDWKSSADIETMRADGMGIYARVCAWTLARAHARSGDPVAIAAYLGAGPAFDKALGRFAHDYADQNERDHAALMDAIQSGRVTAETGV